MAEQNRPDPVGRENDDEFGLVYRGAPDRVERAEVVGRVGEGYVERDRIKNVDEPEPARERYVVHPVLRRWLADRSADEREQVIVLFQEQTAIPRFPEPDSDQPRTASRNQSLTARAEEIVRNIVEARAPAYERAEASITELGGTSVERFWLINGIVAELPLGAVERLAARDDVVSVEPRISGEEPPQDEVDDGRARINSDPYFNLGQTTGWIGLLDTGVRFTHTLFTNPSHIDFRRDCVNGGSDCNTGANLNPNDDCWNHGTASAAIITANNNQGNDFRGVTGITLDSFKVYPTATPCGGLDQAAAIRGFQTAVQVLDRVIVAEMQGGGDHNSAIAVAADAAFDAGAVVIAANGNNGPASSTVNCPANARRVIGVGNFDVQTLAQIPSQSRGPTADGRFKPDIQAPTNTETASNASDTAHMVFTGTSGATPYASGAAALLRNWLRGSSFSIDPGQVYAFMILAGQQPYPFNNDSGAGRLVLPTGGVATWGKVNVSNNLTIDIPFTMPAGRPHDLDAALWWPESGTHNDIDLSLVDPAGVVRDSSISIGSVFERCRVAGPVASGTWLVRVHGFSVPAAPQAVFWAARVGQ
jgi:hypothetical protein